MKRTTKRKGFTLVELLIVIVVIGILSAMMMMSSSEAVSSSKASNITSNLRNLQTAALAYWADNMNKFNSTNPDNPEWDEVLKYLKEDDGVAVSDTGYSLVGKGATNDKGGTYKDGWFVCYHFGNGDDARVKQKVAGRAGSLGLLKEADISKDVYAGGASDNYVYLMVR